MQPIGVGEAPFDWVMGRVLGGALPLVLGRQAHPRPAREGVRLVVAHVRHRFVRVDRTRSGERIERPRAVSPLPVERRVPPGRLTLPPAVGEPELGPFVPAVFHEGEILPARHGSIAEREGALEAPVPRSLVVEGEAATVVSDPDEAFLERARRQRRGPRLRSLVAAAAGRAVRGAERIRVEGVLDVREDELLVLLLVVQPELDDRTRVVVRVASLEAPHQPQDGVVDVAPVGEHLGERRARQEAPLAARRRRAHGLVVGVEQEREARVERAVADHVRAEHEGLEEPARVGEVPLGRARVGHRLHELVLGRERLGEGQRAGTDGAVSVEEGHGAAPRIARRPRRRPTCGGHRGVA